MMDKINIMETVSLSSPHLFGLLVTKDRAGKLNIMGVSWFSFASLKPPMMILCLSNKGYSGSVIEETKEATLCLATNKIEKEAMQCCRCSGKDTDKFSELGFKEKGIDGFKVPAVEGSFLAWSLKLDKKMEAGDHTVYLMLIEDAARMSGKAALYAFDGYKELKQI